MSDPLDVVKDWCVFGEERVYILWAVARRKFNLELTNRSEVVYRRIIESEANVGRCYRDLKAYIDRHDLHFRIYLTVNARNTFDAYCTFLEKANQWAVDLARGHNESIEKLGRIDSIWKSILHQNPAKDDQYFLFDLDDVLEIDVDRFENTLPVSSLLRVETPNGYHVITEPFNYKSWVPPVDYDEVFTDGELFIEEVIHDS